MSLKDTLTAAITGDETEDEADAALERVRNAQKQTEEIEAEGTALSKQLADARTEMGRAALAGDDAKALKLADQVKDIERLGVVNGAARKAADEEIHAAKVALHKLGRAGHVKAALRQTTALLKNDEELIEHIIGVARTFPKHFELAEKIRLSLPVPVTGGMMLHPQEFLKLLQIELWRVLPVHPLMPSKHPPLPGANVPLFHADPTKVKPLIEAVREAMDYIVRRVEEGPAAAAAPKSQPEHGEPIPTIAPDATPRPNGPILAAEQVMAGIAPRKLGG